MLTVVLPTYNESEFIEKTITSIIEQIKKAKTGYEIIVVDDNSPDKTWQIVENLSKINKNIKPYVRYRHKGLSDAIVDAFTIAKGDYLLVMDANGMHDEKKIPEMLKEIKSNDIVIGSRYLLKKDTVNMPLQRIIVSKVASYLASPLLRNKKTTDPMSRFFMIKKKKFNEIKPKLQIKGYKILLDILFASPKNIKIHEMHYNLKKQYRGKSKLKKEVVNDYFRMLIKQSIKEYSILIKAIAIIIIILIVALLIRYF